MNNVTITMKYTRDDFFGCSKCTEDTYTAFDTERAVNKAMKAFRAMFKDADSAMAICNSNDGGGSIVLWREYRDIAAEDDTVTIRIYDKQNPFSYEEHRISKKLAVKTIKSWCEIKEELEAGA